MVLTGPAATPITPRVPDTGGVMALFKLVNWHPFFIPSTLVSPGKARQRPVSLLITIID